MSRKKKGQAVSDEPRIHRVDEDADVHHESHQILSSELDLEELNDQEDLEDVIVNGEVVFRPSWDSVKDSVETLRLAWKSVHGVDLANSDLYALMHTSEHRTTVLSYLES